MRIAVGGFQHETNTFAPIKADLAAFHEKDGWPGLCVGAEMLEEVDGVHLPITGALETLCNQGCEIIPLLWCSATPSAHVTSDAFEKISTNFLEMLENAGPLDGIYLDLHGAMVCEHLEDGEGALLSRIRQLVGPDLPITISLDLHANVTEEMVLHADLIDIFREYPHVDMGVTGARAAQHLLDIINTGKKPNKAFRKIDFLIPLNSGCTYLEPAKSIYDISLPKALDQNVTSLSFACGFHLSDIHDVGPAIVAYAPTQEKAEEAANTLSDVVNSFEDDFRLNLISAEASASMDLKDITKPIILADTQDNPGGGGTGDTTGLIRALIDANIESAVVGVLYDPAAAKKCHSSKIGDIIRLSLGGKNFPTDIPINADFKILALGEGQFTATGPMWGGARMDLGPMALIQIGGVKIAIASKTEQAGDTSMFRHLGVELEKEKLIGLKSSVHFRADFEPIAHKVIEIEAPGPVYADPAKLDYKAVRKNLRLG